MPRSKVLQKKMFREFSKLNQSYVKRNHLKYLRTVLSEFCKKQDIFEKELHFMLWAYDLEFWTLKHAAKDFNFSDRKIGDRIVYPLMKEGLVYKHFDKLTPSQTREDHIFREETKYNYRVRYALTQKARLLVQAFYRELEK
tara:strand:+ start:2718 stop:3140 length:423 start_codon:yes stop_codon:yes gene_type:complete